MLWVVHILLLFKVEIGAHKISAKENNTGMKGDVLTPMPFYECPSVMFRLWDLCKGRKNSKNS